MLDSLFYRIRLLLMICRDHQLALLYRFNTRYLVITGALCVPIALIGTIIFFAYTEHVRLLAGQQRHADLKCLAENIYHEARGESLEGQRAVAEVTMNRLMSPRFPDTVCGVVYERGFDRSRQRHVGAFSWTELTVARPTGRPWRQAQETAIDIYDDQQPLTVPDALYYHASHIRPSWASTRPRLKKIGKHIFYR